MGKIYIYIYIYVLVILKSVNTSCPLSLLSRHSSVGIATLYRLNVTGFEPRCVRHFLHPPRPTSGPIQSPVKWVSGFFIGVKRPGLGVVHPLPF